MSHLDHIENIYFIGIGGIGMSALARYFNEQGKNVAGYDRSDSSLLNSLKSEGISLVFDESVEAIPQVFLDDKNSLIVYTPAILKAHKQYDYFFNENYLLKKRAAVLGLITGDKFTLAVAGTHGKTTTTAILAHLLKETGAKVTAFLGGISEDVQSNLILKGDEVIVVEADEFDRSFLHLSPNIAAITSMDADHLDVYGVEEHLQASFKAFAELIPQDGKLFVRKGLPLEAATFGIGEDADYSAIDIGIRDGWYHFTLKTPTKNIENLQFNLPGKHNLLNAVTALAMAIHFGSPTDELARALYSFKGVQRRFSYKIKSQDLVLIDDYAHHPVEISAVYTAVREMHAGKKVLAVFQPHLYTRTKDFADEFAESLSQFDEVMLMDIYPARELPIEGVSSSWLLGKISNPNKSLVFKANLAEKVLASNCQVVVMMGAGDIGEESVKLKKSLGYEG